jgi:hypothetical protein
MSRRQSSQVANLRGAVEARIPGQPPRSGYFITLIYSIYANLATDYGGMSAAEAAFGETQPPPIPLEPPSPPQPI